MSAPTTEAPATEPAPTEQTPAETSANDSTRQPDELFRYSSWVHVGPGAADCDGREGTCTDPAHFHAWCRMPNQFQHQDIRERALAAKARRQRQLRDPETDANAILEADLAELLRIGDRDTLIDELVNKDWWKRHLDAMREVEEREEFEHIDRDRERMRELLDTDEDARPKDEYDELERHLRHYGDTVEARRKELDQPRRDALSDLDMAELVDQVREDRIVADSEQAFMDAYSKWQWLAGTYTSNDAVGRKRRFAGLDDLAEQAPEVIEALRATFGELETSLQRGTAGN